MDKENSVNSIKRSNDQKPPKGFWDTSCGVSLQLWETKGRNQPCERSSLKDLSKLHKIQTLRIVRVSEPILPAQPIHVCLRVSYSERSGAIGSSVHLCSPTSNEKNDELSFELVHQGDFAEIQIVPSYVKSSICRGNSLSLFLDHQPIRQWRIRVYNPRYGCRIERDSETKGLSFEKSNAQWRQGSISIPQNIDQMGSRVDQILRPNKTPLQGALLQQPSFEQLLEELFEYPTE